MEKSKDPVVMPPALAKKYEQYLKGENIINKRLEYREKKLAEIKPKWEQKEKVQLAKKLKLSQQKEE